MQAEYDESYTRRQTERGRFRKWVRQFYLLRATELVEGPTLDFGCGVGDLLKRLPRGSAGVEYNPATVELCRRMGLTVEWYDGSTDDWSLSTALADERFQSMVISHVLEHLEQPLDVLLKLLHAAMERGISRVLVIVPGRAGFKIDSTHLTFVDSTMLSSPRIRAEAGFSLISSRHFPFNLRAIGDWFPHHELQVVYERRG